MGQPGTAWYGSEHERPVDEVWMPGETETIRSGLSYPAVLDDDGNLLIWRDGQWIPSPGYAPHFEAGPWWQSYCPHEHGAPWRTCDSQAACDSLCREETRTWGE